MLIFLCTGLSLTLNGSCPLSVLLVSEAGGVGGFLPAGLGIVLGGILLGDDETPWVLFGGMV